jgi:hypothetical protein
MESTVHQLPPLKTKGLSLSGMISGQVESRFQAALAELAENMADTRTGLGYRKIKIEISLKPNEDRSAVDVAVSVQTKRQPIEIAEDIVQLVIPAHGPAYVAALGSQSGLPFGEGDDEDDDEEGR